MFSSEFKSNHRKHESAFTRERKLPFSHVVSMIIQKSLKSLQLMLNEWTLKLDDFQTITNSAYSQARQNLSHTAFIELNRECVVALYYSKGDARRWKGYRLVGIDGSRIRLPDSKELKSEFGTIRTKNQYSENEYTSGLASVCYDLLNHIVIDGTLAEARASEANLALDHLEHTDAGDLHITDRNYANYNFWGTLLEQKKDFLCRCSRSSFKEAQSMFEEGAPESKTVMLRAPEGKAGKFKKQGLPLSIPVRFIRVELKTGEVEVLATSLTNKKLYPTSDFSNLYYQRWGVETFYGIIKGRLDLENFTGTTAESIKQDFYATLFISGMETIFCEDAQTKLDEKSVSTKYPQQVNHAVSFNAIKNQVFEIFLSDNDPDCILEKLELLFLTNPVLKRERKSIPRSIGYDTSTLSKHLGFRKRKRKICF